MGDNYYLYVVGVDHPPLGLKKGASGVGRTFVGPGVMDCPYGTLYVVPGDAVSGPLPRAFDLRKKILDYYHEVPYEWKT